MQLIVASALLVVAVNAGLTPPVWYETVKYESPLTAEQKPNAAEFPGATAEKTNAAFPTGKQPANMAAWPRKADGNPEPCWDVKALLEEDQWGGDCLDLDKQEEHKTEEACKEACWKDSLCPTWQWNDATGCWMGAGNQCTTRNGAAKEFNPKSQRLQHGSVLVLHNLEEGTDVEIMGLTKVGMFHDIDGKVASTEVAVKTCKELCYSDIRCQYWQYSDIDGCWYDIGNKVAFPLIRVAAEENKYAKDASAGEYIQHSCPPKAGDASKTVTKIETEVIEKTPNLTWLWILLGVVALAGVIGVVVVVMKNQSHVPKKRAVKVKAAEPEPPKPVPVMMMPMMQTVMPTVSTYAAPPQVMQYAAQPTYAAPQAVRYA